MSNLRICKVKRITSEKSGQEKLILAYDRILPDGDVDTFSLRSSDQPHESLYLAMEDLADYVLETCEVKDSWDAETVRISGVTFLHGEDGRYGIVVTAQKILEASNSPLILNTPLRRSFDESDDKSLDPRTEDIVERLLRECGRYIDGDRVTKQLNFLEPDDVNYDEALEQAKALGLRFGFVVTEVRQLQPVR